MEIVLLFGQGSTTIGAILTNFTIPKGLFLEKSNFESQKIWESLSCSLDALIKADPFYGKFFYALVYLKQETDGTQNRHAFVQVRTVRPQACPDTALFKILPKTGEFHLCYWLPAFELMDAFKTNGPLADPLIAGWVKAFEDNELSDPTDHDFTKEELYMMASGHSYAKTEEEMKASMQGFTSKFSKV